MRFNRVSRLITGWTVCLVLSAADSPAPTTPRPNLRTATESATSIRSSNVTVRVGRRPATDPKNGNQSARFLQAKVEEFDKLRARPDAVVLDVRTAEEFADGHLPNAGLADIKLPDFPATIAKLDRSKLYLVNCASGGRSARACQSLVNLGFTNVVNLDGGFNAWKKAKPDAISKAPAVKLPMASTNGKLKSDAELTRPITK